MTNSKPVINADVSELELAPITEAAPHETIVPFYNVTGLNLVGPVTIDAPEPVQVSLTPEGPFSSSVQIPPSKGRVLSTKVFVRLQSSSPPKRYERVGILISSDSAQNLTVWVSGTVLRSVSPKDELHARVKAFAEISREINTIFSEFVRPYVAGLLIDEEINYRICLA